MFLIMMVDFLIFQLNFKFRMIGKKINFRLSLINLSNDEKPN
jgi:hypothetical protein